MELDLSTTDHFAQRQIGPGPDDLKDMLQVIGVESPEALIDETIPESIRFEKPLCLPESISEYNLLKKLRNKAQKNRIFRSYIGLGYYNCITPGVILRNIFENPGWYTQYTPYQAEISQGRLEALMIFQTMIRDITALEIANASLLDESTAAAEAMTMFHRTRSGKTSRADTFFVSDECLPQTIDVLKTRAAPLGINIVTGNFKNHTLTDEMFGAIVQYPAADGEIYDYREFIKTAHEKGIRVVMAADLMSLLLIAPPGELGADAAVGNTQRFGVPPGYGGPHAAYFAVRSEFVRQTPGRLIGISVDSLGNKAYRMALQTREQHIRREKATSNICTAQALLAIMAGMYGVYHGPEGLRNIALRIHALTGLLEDAVRKFGYEQLNKNYFDTLKVKVDDTSVEKIRDAALGAEINFRYMDNGCIGISLDETTMPEDVEDIIGVLSAGLSGQKTGEENSNIGESIVRKVSSVDLKIPDDLVRKSEYLKHPFFHSYRSETAMMRYIKELEKKDLALNTAMIPLGSCTMKLNAASEMFSVSWPEFSSIHPFVPENQVSGYTEIINELEKYLCEITGFSAASFQPNSGAQGEFAGLLVIRAYHHDRNDLNRDVVLIPASAHGTNPASAIMAGMKPVTVKCDDFGNISLEDLELKAEKYSNELAALMVTYPSTHGVFEEDIRRVCEIIHQNGGQVYMDGANMNAQAGFTSPAVIGADVCHLNLHKTFGIPHGGGGPGVGPICVARHIAPYLPGHSIVPGTGGDRAISAVAAAPFGSANILLISYAYILLLGEKGLKEATTYAILNANYIKSRLEKDYKILYTGKKGRVAHEMIIDFRPFKKSSGIDVEDAAKRLIDYGFHAPTMSFPIPGTLMVEPTESEPKKELDRFCDAMLLIYQEICEVRDGKADPLDNVLKNSPHTAADAGSDKWNRPYSRDRAVFPVEGIAENKYWPPVARIDNVHGDRNLCCNFDV